MSRVIAEVQTPGRRRRSEAKKAAILDAAESLFIAEGYERASVDAIAARARVSKRTVYDHFADKATVFLRVLERANDSVVTVIEAAIEEELTPGRDLRAGLVAFGRRVVAETFPSSDYVTFRRLTAQRRSAPQLPEAARERPERMLEERFAALVTAGEIRASDPRLAVRHFTALTFGLALDALDRSRETGEQGHPGVDDAIVDGVDAFLRAYR